MWKFALNPIQWFATPDGWVDPSVAPPLRQRLGTIAEHGFTAVQTELPPPEEEGAYFSLLAEYGIRPGPGYLSVAWSPEQGVNHKLVDNARRVAAAHARLGVDVVFVSSGMSKTATRVQLAAVGHEADQRRLASIADLMGAASAAMRAEGVTAALHPHVGTWIETEAETRWVLDNTSAGDLKFGPDLGHLAWAGADYLQLLTEYKARIPAVHLKDFNADIAAASRRDPAPYQKAILAGLWREPGYGDCDFDAAFGILGEAPDRWAVIEVDFPTTSTPGESIALCGSWLRRTFPQ